MGGDRQLESSQLLTGSPAVADLTGLQTVVSEWSVWPERDRRDTDCWTILAGLDAQFSRGHYHITAAAAAAAASIERDDHEDEGAGKLMETEREMHISSVSENNIVRVL